MLIALTGTPGTGKTTVAALLDFKVVDINNLVKEGLSTGVDPARGCLIADMDALEKKIEELDANEIIILEGHLSHHLADEAIVLRLAPDRLLHRLRRRGYPEEKVRENLEAEVLDVILVEAVELCKRVHEIDTTDKLPEEVAELIVKVILGEIELSPGRIDWIEEIDFDLG